MEVFVTGKGLPVTDLEFGPDGAMYFTTGGRGTQAGLYRVSWAGEAAPWTARPAKLPPGVVIAGRTGTRQIPEGIRLRRFLETPAEGNADNWLDGLNSADAEDRYMRFAARIALETEPTAKLLSQR